jgi:1,4-alpha-glucan branching enzyme
LMLFFGLTGRLRSTVVVHLELTAPDAGSVSLVGDFNDWEPSRLMLKDPDQDGVWEIRLRLPKGGSYTYNFIINGDTWVTDPNALIHVKDGFGGESSILSL